MRIVRRPSEHLVDPLDQPLRDDVLEVLGFVVHFRPAHAHHLDEEQFDEAVTPQHECPASFSPAALNRTPLYGSYSANPDSASAFTIVVAVPGVTPSAPRPAPSETRRANRPAATTCPWCDRLQVVLDGARRKHRRRYYPQDVRSTIGLRRRTASAGSCRRCLPRLPIGAILLRSFSRMARIAMEAPARRARTAAVRAIALDLATGTGDLAYLMHDRQAGRRRARHHTGYGDAGGRQASPHVAPAFSGWRHVLCPAVSGRFVRIRDHRLRLRNVPDLAGAAVAEICPSPGS